MKAVNFDRPGPPEVMKIIQCGVPEIGDQQVLIEVKYSGVNRPDIIQREGNYPAPPGHSKTLGLEVSGIVSKIGSRVKNFKEGEKVAALVNGGGYAEYCVADQETTFKVPKNISLKEAACIPECFFTVWSNLITRGKLKTKESVLIHGGTSGIGIAAIQILKLFECEIFTTVGNKDKERFCKKIGVQHVLNYQENDFLDEIKKIKPKGLNMILDFVGGEYIQKNIDLLSTEGRLINIGFQNGSKANLNLMKIMLKRITLTGSTLRIRSPQFKGGILNELKKFVFPSFENGKIKCYIDSTFKINDVISSHKRIQEGKHIGKVVLEF
jgi:NADPH2:quinone reductase